MLERLATAHQSVPAEGLDIRGLVESVVRAKYDEKEAQRAYLAKEHELEAVFADYVEDKPVVATRRYHAAVGGRQWEVRLSAPLIVSAVQPEADALSAYPFRSFKVDDSVFVNERLADGNGSVGRWVAAPEEIFRPRTYGFYITTLAADDVLGSKHVSEPWNHNYRDASLGEVERLASDSLSTMDLTVTPAKQEEQASFELLLSEVITASRLR